MKARKLNITQAKKYIKKTFSLNKAPTSDYNKQIFKKAITNKWDIERANYQANLLLDENYDSEFIKNQALFEMKNISIIKFLKHFMEGFDCLFCIFAIIGLIISALSAPLLSYLNSLIFTHVGNTSEERENLTEEELMKLNVKHEMNSEIKKELLFGSIEIVGNIVGYGFFGLLTRRCIYNFKKKYFSLILSQEQLGLILQIFMNSQQKYKHK